MLVLIFMNLIFRGCIIIIQISMLPAAGRQYSKSVNSSTRKYSQFGPEHYKLDLSKLMLTLNKLLKFKNNDQKWRTTKYESVGNKQPNHSNIKKERNRQVVPSKTPTVYKQDQVVCFRIKTQERHSHIHRPSFDSQENDKVAEFNKKYKSNCITSRAFYESNDQLQLKWQEDPANHAKKQRQSTMLEFKSPAIPFQQKLKSVSLNHRHEQSHEINHILGKFKFQNLKTTPFQTDHSDNAIQVAEQSNQNSLAKSFKPYFISSNKFSEQLRTARQNKSNKSVEKRQASPCYPDDIKMKFPTCRLKLQVAALSPWLTIPDQCSPHNDFF